MILKYIFTNSIGILISRILGFIRDLFMAAIIGANIYSDIFFVAFKLPNLFRRIFAEGAFTQVFIPSFAKTNQKIRFSSAIFLSFMTIILILCLIVTLFSHLITKLIAYGFDTNTIKLAAPLLAINFYYLILIFIVTFCASLLQYKKHFTTTAFSTSLLNLSLIFTLIIFQNHKLYDITYYLSYAVLVGGVLQVVVHIIALKKYNLLKIFNFKNIKLKQEKFYKKFAQSCIGNSTLQLSTFIDTILASFLITGSISYIYYAQRVFQLPLALFAISSSIALFPIVSRAIKNKDENKALLLLRNISIKLFIVLILASFIGIFFASDIIKLLFQRGQFLQSHTNETSIILIMYLIGLIPYGIAKIFSLWLYSNNNQLTATKISIKALLFNIIFSLILIKPYGTIGLALASSLSGFVLLYLLIKDFGFNRAFDLYISKKTRLK